MHACVCVCVRGRYNSTLEGSKRPCRMSRGISFCNWVGKGGSECCMRVATYFGANFVLFIAS